MTFLLLPENEFQLEEWKKTWEDVADELIDWRPHNWAGIYPDIHPPASNAGFKARSCGRPINGPLCVYPNGDVTPCCFSWDKSMVMGNVHNQSLEDIYFSERRKEIQRIHAES